MGGYIDGEERRGWRQISFRFMATFFAQTACAAMFALRIVSLCVRLKEMGNFCTKTEDIDVVNVGTRSRSPGGRRSPGRRSPHMSRRQSAYVAAPPNSNAEGEFTDIRGASAEDAGSDRATDFMSRGVAYSSRVDSDFPWSAFSGARSNGDGDGGAAIVPDDEEEGQVLPEEHAQPMIAVDGTSSQGETEGQPLVMPVLEFDVATGDQPTEASHRISGASEQRQSAEANSSLPARTGSKPREPEQPIDIELLRDENIPRHKNPALEGNNDPSSGGGASVVADWSRPRSPSTRRGVYSHLTAWLDDQLAVRVKKVPRAAEQQPKLAAGNSTNKIGRLSISSCYGQGEEIVPNGSAADLFAAAGAAAEKEVGNPSFKSNPSLSKSPLMGEAEPQPPQQSQYLTSPPTPVLKNEALRSKLSSRRSSAISPHQQ